MDKWLPVIGIPVLFPLLWCFMCFLGAQIGGWNALASHFRTTAPPQGKAFHLQSGRIGIINYGSCLTIHVSEVGMFVAVFPLFRIGHPPLFIPWSEFNNLREKRIMFWRFIEAPIGTPPIARLLLRPGIIPDKVLEACQPHSR